MFEQLIMELEDEGSCGGECSSISVIFLFNVCGLFNGGGWIVEEDGELLLLLSRV